MELVFIHGKILLIILGSNLWLRISGFECLQTNPKARTNVALILSLISSLFPYYLKKENNPVAKLSVFFPIISARKCN